MSKSIFIFLLLNFFVAENLFAQKEDRNWVFGDSCGIDFNNLSSPQFFNSVCINNESNASYSDGNGNLKFYVSDQTQIQPDCRVFNSQNQIMENGDSVLHYFSATNGALIIPMPGDSNQFYLFTMTHVIANCALNYSIIDLSFNGGLGKVISKNNFLIDSLTEHLVGIKHGNGRDWWVITKQAKNNLVIKFLITPTGISGPFTQQIGSVFELLIAGEGAASRSGNKMAFVNTLGNTDVFDFDRCTGELSNWLELGTAPYDTIPPDTLIRYGCEFSPDGNRFYVSREYEWGVFNTVDIIQYTLNAPVPKTTKAEIYFDYGHKFFGQMQLAPDDKIYIAGTVSQIDSNYKYLSTIDSPNDSANACSFNLYSFYLQGHSNLLGLPNIPNYNLGALEGSACDTLTAIQNENLKTKNSVSIYPNPASNELAVSSSQFAINTIEITDALGRKIYSEKINLKSSTGLREKIINLKSFPPGVYFIKLQMQNGEMQVKKFVKE